MQHVNVVKKLIKDPTLRVGGGGGLRVCRQNICYHVVAFVIPLYILSNRGGLLKSNKN